MVAAEATARTGFDYVCADLQHGALDYADSVGLFQAVLVAGSTPIARVPWNEPGVIGKVLDAGAEGRHRADGQQRRGGGGRGPCGAVPAARRPQLRADRGRLARSSDYAADANDVVAVIPMIETVDALGHLDDILVRARRRRHLRRSGRPVAQPRAAAREQRRRRVVPRGARRRSSPACRRHGVVAGIHATGALTPRRLEQGFAMVTVTSDTVALRLGLAAEMAAGPRRR